MRDTDRTGQFAGSLLSDAPLSEGEPDILGHETLATTIAETIRTQHKMAQQTKTPSTLETSCPAQIAQAYTIGLSGPWGSGKTSVLNAVGRILAPSKPQSPVNSLAILSNLNPSPKLNNSDSNIRIVRFEPWLISGGASQLTSEFLSILAREISPAEGRRVDIAKALSAYQSALELADSNAPVGLTMSITGKLIKAGSQVHTTQREDLNALRAKVSRLLSQGKTTYVVMIDDLDRLMPPDIRTVFQMVRCIADFPNIVYLLAYDRDMVAAALDGESPGKSDELEDALQGNSTAMAQYGHKYLEKVIQVPLQIPPAAPWMIEQQLLLDLTKIPDFRLNERWRSWLSIVTMEISTLRMAKRLINTFIINYNHRFSSELLHDGADAFVLFGLTTLEVLWPNVYHSAVKNRHGLLRPEQTKRNKTIDLIAPEDGPPRKLLKLMFDVGESPFFGYLDFDAPGRYYSDSYLHEIIQHGTGQAFTENLTAKRLQTLLDELAEIIYVSKDLYPSERCAELFVRFFNDLHNMVPIDSQQTTKVCDTLVANSYYLFSMLQEIMSSDDQYAAIKLILEDFSEPCLKIKFWNALNSCDGLSSSLTEGPSQDIVLALGHPRANELQALVNSLQAHSQGRAGARKRILILSEKRHRQTADRLPSVFSSCNADAKWVDVTEIDPARHCDLDGIVVVLNNGNFKSDHPKAPSPDAEVSRALETADMLQPHPIAVCDTKVNAPKGPQRSSYTLVDLPDCRTDAARFKKELHDWLKQIP